MSRAPLADEFIARHDAEFIATLDSVSPTSIRLNPSKPFDQQWTDTVPWCEDGRYLSTRPSFTLDPRFAAGAYYVQEASSMFLGWIFGQLDLPSSVAVLDLCAAPGGKSTHLQALVGAGSVVVANEVIRQRAGILTQNITKWGAGNGVVTCADAALLGSCLPSTFDVMVVDAPCSGEGMFRRDDTARREWSLQNVDHCAARARRILSDSWNALRDGGFLIFSTCTFNRTENEQNVLWAARELGAQVVMLPGAPAGVEQSEAGYRFSPNKIRGEGFFIAVLRKTAEAPSQRRVRVDTKKIERSDRFTRTPLLQIERDGTMYGYSEPLLHMVSALREARVQMLTAGVEIGQMMHGTLKPSHSLALYSGIDRGAFASTDLTLDDALCYLRKNIIDPELLEQGLQLITYQGLPLGWAKRIDSRVNNLYPTTWRILLA